MHFLQWLMLAQLPLEITMLEILLATFNFELISNGERGVTFSSMKVLLRLTQLCFTLFFIEQHDHCEQRPCKNNATCVYNEATFTCVCAPWYTGQFCEGTIPKHNRKQFSRCVKNDKENSRDTKKQLGSVHTELFAIALALSMPKM